MLYSIATYEDNIYLITRNGNSNHSGRTTEPRPHASRKSLEAISGLRPSWLPLCRPAAPPTTRPVSQTGVCLPGKTRLPLCACRNRRSARLPPSCLQTLPQTRRPVDPTIHPARSYRLLLFSCEETTPPSLLTPSIPRATGKATELPCALRRPGGSDLSREGVYFPNIVQFRSRPSVHH